MARFFGRYSHRAKRTVLPVFFLQTPGHRHFREPTRNLRIGTAANRPGENLVHEISPDKLAELQSKTKHLPEAQWKSRKERSAASADGSEDFVVKST